MTDIPYTSSGLEDWCPEASSSRGANWLGISGLALGVLALGTALYAAFAPRSVVNRGAEAVRNAVSRSAQKAREAARSIGEQAENTVGAYSPGT